MAIETKELVISEKLKKVEMICRFANVKYSIINGYDKKIKFKNFEEYVKSH